ncbi:polyphenol oxidase family protein [Isoptericola sp. b441]|uniref:Polyphenol oxidase family protein n=1 Tax=Actinotalea lenta TaxID=3064654 RepID=A0ABT9D963_9CELL|nr:MULTISPECIES: polyphenol oxidase family protein [unclassified Isoptericola]MDO8107431.1 polyphenol oxidase family protein [Isoptericola sp. b441]MDO8120907.1 polyphenol oxidase family protein [Isoptericola sp. b490]
MTAPWLEVDLGAGVRAGFSTVGLGNLGLGIGDDPEAVTSRRRAAEGWAGGPLAWGRQVHGATVHRVGSRGGDDVAACDAMVSEGPVGLAVLAADCVPVVLADPEARLVGVAHAGRAGLVAGVVPAVVRVLRDAGARSLRAVIGPAICGACYEVPPDMVRDVTAAVPGAASTTSWGTTALDLPGTVARTLADLGVAVTDLGACTRTDPRFFSHRGHGPGRPSGRIAGVVRLV